MKKLYFISYFGEDPILETKLISLGRNFEVFNGWIVESLLDAKTIYAHICSHNLNMTVIVLGIDKANYWGRHEENLWKLFK